MSHANETLTLAEFGHKKAHKAQNQGNPFVLFCGRQTRRNQQMLRRFLPATITFAFSLIILTSGLTQVQEFRVTDASLKPLEPKSDGPCPVTVRFSGSITTNGPGTVKYTL